MITLMKTSPAGPGSPTKKNGKIKKKPKAVSLLDSARITNPKEIRMNPRNIRKL